MMLLETMSEFGVEKIVFSSSATVYDSSDKPPLKENMKLGTTDSYDSTKFMIEEILRDLYNMCLDSWNWQNNNPNGYGK